MSLVDELGLPDLPGVAGEGSTTDLSFVQFLLMWNWAQGRSTPLLHERLAFWMEKHWRTGLRRLLLTVFRDAGKSTIVGLFCCWILRRAPDLRILVLSAEHNLACKMTRAIRRIIERHPATAGLLPDSHESWTQDQLTVRRVLVQRDPSVLARGIGANITGSRADVIICDDVEVPNTSGTPHKRRELRDKLREISFILVPGGSQVYVGTPHTYYSIYGRIAHVEIGEDRPFLHDFRQLNIPIVDSQGQSAWPERFTAAEIERLRLEVGPTRFRSQMLLEPTRSDDIRLDPDRLQPYALPLSGPHGAGVRGLRIGRRAVVATMAAWDPAYARPESGDGSAIAAVMLDNEGHYWLHAMEYLDPHRDRPPELDEATYSCRLAIAFARRLHVGRMLVETNGVGRFLPSILRKEIRAQGGGLTVLENHVSLAKDRRILEAFDPLLAARRLHVHEAIWGTPFIEEMREWRAGGKHRDDGLDAVAACILAMPARIGESPVSRSWGGHGEAGFAAQTLFNV